MSRPGETGEPREIVRAMVDALNTGDVDAFVDFYAPDVVVRMMGSGDTIEGVDSVRSWIEGAYDALEGFSNDVVGIYDDGDVVALEVVARGRANRDFAGRSEGEMFDNPELYVYRLDNGRIREARVYL